MKRAAVAIAVAAVTLLLCACDGAGSSTDAAVRADAVSSGDGGAGVDPELAKDIAARLAGLWSAPVHDTPLGSFPLMNVEFRPAGEILFGRVDLDDKNNLRFAFSVEQDGRTGKTQLIYRNGGFFGGILRDDRATLIEHDAARGFYRFCHLTRGCEYVDAQWTFSAADKLSFDVWVRGNKHVSWKAARRREDPLPSTFDLAASSGRTTTSPFPSMPRLEVTARWSGALSKDALVLLSLTREDCLLGIGDCDISRSLVGQAKAGSASAKLVVDQLHPGSYKINAVLDRNGNLFPDKGDAIAIPNLPLEVKPSGDQTGEVEISLPVP